MSVKMRGCLGLLPYLAVMICAGGVNVPASFGQDAKDAMIDRLKKEVVELQAIVKDLQKTLEQTQVEQARKLEAAQVQVKALADRNAKLEDVVRRMEAALTGKKVIGGPRVEPARANPPAVNLKGTVVKTDPKNATLVEISLGSDAGLEVGHTLDAYRLKPMPRYLGMVRIVAVSREKAVGQLVSGTPGLALRAGDQVVSHLTARDEKKK